MSSYLEVKELSKTFMQNGQALNVLDDISFTLSKSEFLCVLGASGCGKTTLLRCLAGLETPTSGIITLDGQLITKPGILTSMVFQTFDQLFPWKTVIENVAYPLRVKDTNLKSKESRLIAMQYLDNVGLSRFADYYPHQLSGGMKQRVAIARALAQKPSLLLMDEPYASLDADTRTTMQQELLDLWNQSKMTIVFVTHSIIEAVGLGSQFMVLSPQTGYCSYFRSEVSMIDGKLRTPENEGFHECWSTLKNQIRMNKL